MLDRDKIEKSLLLGIIRDKNWNVLLLNNITKDCFSYANYRLYDYIKSFTDEGNYPDIRVVINEFEIEDYMAQEYLLVTNLKELCDVLHKEYIKNQLTYKISQLNEHNSELEVDPVKFLDRMDGIVDDIKKISYYTKSVDLFENIDKVLSIDRTNSISTGFKELDDKLGGWQKGEELVVLAGRTGQGKSWMGMKFSIEAAFQGKRVGIYSGEMSQIQLQERMLDCAKPQYTSTRDEALQRIKENNVFIRVITQKELRRKATVSDIEEFIIRDKLDMVVIDQLSLMEDNTCAHGTPVRQQYGNISMDLFSLTTKHSIPIILLVQVNRQGNENKSGPALENIAESDAVAQNATRVITLKRDGDVLTLNIVKNRYGNGGVQQYDVDYGRNKYRPIVDVSQSVISNRGGRGVNPYKRKGTAF